MNKCIAIGGFSGFIFITWKFGPMAVALGLFALFGIGFLILFILACYTAPQLPDTDKGGE